MGEKGSERLQKRNPQNRVMQRRVSRRGFNTGAVGGLLGVAAAMSGGAFLGNKARIKEGIGGIVKSLDDINGVVVERISDEPTNFDLAFPGLYDSEKLEAIAKVEEARKSLDGYNGPEMAANVSKYDELVRKSVKEYDIPADFLIGMIITESKGDKFAVSSAGAKGLTQMGDLIARKHNLHISDADDDDRFDPEKIIPATVSELSQLVEKEGTLAGAIQEWHMGEDHYQGFKRRFLVKMGVELPDINVSPKNDSPRAIKDAYDEGIFRINLYRLTTVQKRVSPFKIFKDPQIHEIVQDPSWNDTENYIPYVLAGIDKYYQEKPK